MLLVDRCQMGPERAKLHNKITWWGRGEDTVVHSMLWETGSMETTLVSARNRTLFILATASKDTGASVLALRSTSFHERLFSRLCFAILCMYVQAGHHTN